MVLIGCFRLGFFDTSLQNSFSGKFCFRNFLLQHFVFTIIAIYFAYVANYFIVIKKQRWRILKLQIYKTKNWQKPPNFNRKKRQGFYMKYQFSASCMSASHKKSIPENFNCHSSLDNCDWHFQNFHSVRTTMIMIQKK